MSGELDIRSLSVTAAAKLLRVPAKAIRAHIARGLPCGRTSGSTLSSMLLG